ncbi:MAG: hypothetical protein WDA71_10145 [Actinomycetota bacterium]
MTVKKIVSAPDFKKATGMAVTVGATAMTKARPLIEQAGHFVAEVTEGVKALPATAAKRVGKIYPPASKGPAAVAKDLADRGQKLARRAGESEAGAKVLAGANAIVSTVEARVPALGKLAAPLKTMAAGPAKPAAAKKPVAARAVAKPAKVSPVKPARKPAAAKAVSKPAAGPARKAPAKSAAAKKAVAAKASAKPKAKQAPKSGR